MAICSAFGCDNSKHKNKNVTFHKFPSDKIIAQKWKIAMKRKGFEPAQYSYVCSAHFKSTDYETVGQDGKPLKLKRLKKSAVPSVFTAGLPAHLQAPEKKRGGAVAASGQNSAPGTPTPSTPPQSFGRR